MNERSKRAIPLGFAFLWSTGFIGAKYLLPYAEPFTILAIRFSLAATILTLIALAMKAPMRMSGSQLRRAAYISIFLHLFYTGGVFVAVSNGVTAGITAVIVSLQPVLVALIAIPVLGEKLRVSQLVGLGMGFPRRNCTDLFSPWHCRSFGIVTWQCLGDNRTKTIGF
jgi:drug/metabolite transporter (DMT)-like permease